MAYTRRDTESHRESQRVTDMTVQATSVVTIHTLSLIHTQRDITVCTYALWRFDVSLSYREREREREKQRQT